jgi:voltage-gated potassium channel Kch
VFPCPACLRGRDELQPGAFAAPTPIGPDDYVARVMQMRYFSFVTLTTVGYGDVVPRTPAARTLAMLEAIMGQFYLVALVGRLVGLHIVHGNVERSR